MPLEQKIKSFWCVVWMFKTRIGQQQHHNCGGDETSQLLTYVH